MDIIEGFAKIGKGIDTFQAPIILVKNSDIDMICKSFGFSNPDVIEKDLYEEFSPDDSMSVIENIFISTKINNFHLITGQSLPKYIRLDKKEALNSLEVWLAKLAKRFDEVYFFSEFTKIVDFYYYGWCKDGKVERFEIQCDDDRFSIGDISNLEKEFVDTHYNKDSTGNFPEYSHFSAGLIDFLFEKTIQIPENLIPLLPVDEDEVTLIGWNAEYQDNYNNSGY